MHCNTWMCLEGKKKGGMTETLDMIRFGLKWKLCVMGDVLRKYLNDRPGIVPPRMLCWEIADIW